MKSGLDWAELTYKRLADGHGEKDDQVKDEPEGEDAPIRGTSCSHGEATWPVRVFWYRGERDGDGRCCTYKSEGK